MSWAKTNSNSTDDQQIPIHRAWQYRARYSVIRGEKSMQILCSTGALIGRPNGRDYRLLKTYAPQIDCDGFEFILYNTWYPVVGDLTAFLERLQLNIPVMHCEKSLAELIARGGEEEKREAFRLFRINCELAARLGCRKLVMHLWNGMISDSNFENNLAAYPVFRETAEEFGLDLLIENVVCHKDPMSHWKELYRAYPDIHFVFDTKMADFHRQLELLYQPEYEWLWKDGHIRHYHVNDYGGGYMDWENLKVLAPGKGHIDFDRFYQFIGKTGYRDTFTFEATGFDQQGNVHTDMLNEQFNDARNRITQLR